MTDKIDASRRQALKFGAAALAALPVLGISTSAFAAQNADVRKALAYQGSPKDGKSCATCVNFKAAEKGCSLYPGDTEISPSGYCTGFVAKS